MVLKRFDFFRKIQTEQELSSTTGGMFTIGSFIVAGILILLSIQDFTSVHYVTTLRVKNDPTEYIPMTIDILFNAAPCELITIKFHDELEFIETGLQNKLKMFVVENGNERPYVKSQNHEEMKKNANEGIQNEIQCRVEGTLNLPKTPGTLTFDTNGDGLTSGLSKENFEKLRASYFLKKLVFGEALNPFELPVTHSSEIVENYVKKLEGDFATRTFVQDFRNNKNRINFYNHLKIIPIYVDDGKVIEEKERQKYRYSLRAGSVGSLNSPILEIFTELEPINIVYTKNNMTFYDLCVDILAIAGGSVATIGVINSIYHFIFRVQ